ncbi:trypsin-like serine protease [Micromonospora sp. 4G55]|uniref:trypsin-like serine protease n=1 Tax=Micromonospora sp. 4G55 TaxID=2806102 RepID=UPI001A3AC772|nr:trypsin-like serine protease [Micromonospora sp. 4G55]MBM0257276.1 trypsin-like peptidase domain-containing protein [Micromonospora sp. 4G55]
MISTVGATTVALTREGDAGATPTAVSAAGGLSATAGAAPADTPPSADSGIGSRAAAGRSTVDTRPVTAVGRPATEVAKDAPASVAYLSDRYRITQDEAARRVALQELSAPLAATLATRYPAEYAGMWLDQAGGGVLTIAATDPAPVTKAVAGVPDAAHVTVVPVRHSLRELTDAAARVAGALGATAGTDVVVDEQANEVLVLTGGAVAADDARLAGAIEAAGVPARTRQLPAAVEKSCDPRYCAQAPMRGGIRLDVPRDDGTVGGCTSAFNLRARSGRYYLLTAGHCVVGGRHQLVDRTWHQFLGPKVPVGVESTAPVLAENTDAYDYAVIPYQDGAIDRWAYPRRSGGDQASLVNYWCVTDNPACATKGSHDVKITGYTAYSAVQVGWVVCATGSAYTPKAGEVYVDSGAGDGYVPGTRCGTVTGKTNGRIGVRVCARPGDSGGPLFTESDGRALGILNDGDPGSGACTNPNEQNFYMPVSTILDRVNANTGLGIQLATRGPLLNPIGSSNR